MGYGMCEPNCNCDLSFYPMPRSDSWHRTSTGACKKHPASPCKPPLKPGLKGELIQTTALGSKSGKSKSLCLSMKKPLRYSGKKGIHLHLRILILLLGRHYKMFQIPFPVKPCASTFHPAGTRKPMYDICFLLTHQWNIISSLGKKN